jgi:Dyp-type peroxidase family
VSLSEPVLDVDSIQGNSLGGFSKDKQALVFLEIVDSSAVRKWLRTMAPWIATLREIIDFGRIYRAIRSRRGFNAGTVRANWINIAFSYRGLRKLTNDADLFTDAAFKANAAQRSTILGETDHGQFDRWVVGRPGNEPDLLLILACDDDTSRSDFLDRIGKTFGSAVKVSYLQFGDAPRIPNAAHEHFGFRDGISQPAVRGRLPGNNTSQDNFLTPRENPLNPHEGRPGQPLIWPGEFVFGYPGQNPDDMISPGSISGGGPAWAKDGSFLVFRRYRQDVGLFRDFLAQTAARMQSQGVPPMSTASLAAKLVGRWFSGAPLLRAPNRDDPAIANDELQDNYFDYQRALPALNPDGRQSVPASIADPDGLVCPFASHIRRAYPRDDLGNRAEVETHRIIRRGIPFGPPYPDEGERGLLFIGYVTSIERQFEFVIRNWFNNPDVRMTGAGYEPLIGQSEGINRQILLKFPLPSGRVRSVQVQLPKFTSVTGGGYFFAPSIAAIGQLAS